ncbi:MAG: hypothetical protein RXR43_09140 [Sulfolobus sp.]|jgi:hypothetical protein|nr:hypothetical protein [Stygiolobus sp.]
MGRTQPSLTRQVEGELEKLIRISKKLRDDELRKNLEALLPHIRQVEEAFQDELADPLEVLLVAILMRCNQVVSDRRET